MIEFYKTFGTETKKIEALETGCWINVISPTEEEKNFLIENLVKSSRLETGIITAEPKVQSIAPLIEHPASTSPPTAIPLVRVWRSSSVHSSLSTPTRCWSSSTRCK